MKKFFIILLLLLVVLTISTYMIQSYRKEVLQAQELNQQYEKYYNIKFLGTELISIINKTVDINNKNHIAKDEKGYYIDNQNNSINIYINFIYKDETKTIQMEDIEKKGSESFVRVYSTASFKCVNIEYHEKTKNIKSLTFEELVEKNN